MIFSDPTPTLTSLEGVGLRAIQVRDANAWRAVRSRNRAWLTPWDATSPLGDVDVPPTFGSMVRMLKSEARAGRTIPWVITQDQRIVGQLTVGGISYGSLRSAHMGYWMDSAFAGRGIAPTAVAMGIDYCFRTLHLHRIEINVRPENEASKRVVEKLGMRYEGTRLRYLHINGEWHDHFSYAITVDELTGTMLDRLRARTLS